MGANSIERNERGQSGCSKTGQVAPDKIAALAPILRAETRRMMLLSPLDFSPVVWWKSGPSQGRERGIRRNPYLSAEGGSGAAGEATYHWPDMAVGCTFEASVSTS